MAGGGTDGNSEKQNQLNAAEMLPTVGGGNDGNRGRWKRRRRSFLLPRVVLSTLRYEVGF